MTNSERIQANNEALQECIDIAESLPDVGGSSGANLDAFCVIDPYGTDPYGYGVVFEKGMTWEELINSSYNIDNRITSVNGYVTAYGLDHADTTYISMYTSATSDSEFIRTADKIVATQYYNVDYVPTDSGDNGDDSGGEETITFQIVYPESYGTKTFYAEEGMTWGLWVDSEYNNDSFYLSDSGYILFDEGGYGFAELYAVCDGGFMHSENVIEANKQYDYDVLS